MSKIGWLKRPGTKPESWNPIRARHKWKIGWHCVKCAPGCLNCWAAQQNKLGLRGGTLCDYAANSPAEVYLDEKTLEAPLHWRDPRTVFPCSMSDLFGEWVEDRWIWRIFLDVICACPQHTFLVLTKRPRRMMEVLHRFDPTLSNVWAGTSISTQADADKNLPWLAEIEAAVRWVSYEPVLGAVDWHLTNRLVQRCPVEWLVIGGESGPRHRTLNIDHVASAVDQCRKAGVPPFVKQDSGPFPGKQGRIPDDLWIQEWPEAAKAAEEE